MNLRKIFHFNPHYSTQYHVREGFIKKKKIEFSKPWSGYFWQKRKKINVGLSKLLGGGRVRTKV